jgi:hypothetical protein
MTVTSLSLVCAHHPSTLRGVGLCLLLGGGREGRREGGRECGKEGGRKGGKEDLLIADGASEDSQ